MLVNEIGPYKGKSLAVIPDGGKYMLKVESDGSWKADIKQSILRTSRALRLNYPVRGTMLCLQGCKAS